MNREASTVPVGDYLDECARQRENPPADYHPATAREPRRCLTWHGDLLAGSRNGEGHSNWKHRANVIVHMAVTGAGYAYGTSVAACNGSFELSEAAEVADLVKATAVDEELRCRRPACRALWPTTSAPVPAQPAPTEGVLVT